MPATYGGYELDFQSFVDIGIAVAEADPSMGWITTFYMEHNWLLTMFPEELQEEVWGSAPFVLAPGTVNPSGTATPLDDGTFCLTGRWQFGTGICHADWVLLSGKIEGDDSGIPRNFLCPVDSVEVKDTWHVDGMVATGSHDIVANAVHVPERQVTVRPTAGDAVSSEYLRRLPVFPFLGLTAAIPSVGAARRAVELFRRVLAERVPFGTKKTQSHRAPVR